ncbi:ROK family protein [Candidatus Dojkabacteria bacterium]|nr:ROK family protein [Candidatus Dojkabacteria bacterium]
MYITIDVGGTNSRITSFESLTNPEIGEIISFKNEDSYNSDMTKIIKAIEQIGGSGVDKIGICVPAVIDKKKEKIISCSNLMDWINKPIRNDLIQRFNCPVFLENDAVASALAEAYFGYGKRKDFILVIWGTGIGGTAVKFFKGNPLVEPFEPGHHILDFDGPECTCGQKGCIQLSCGGSGIQYTFKKTAENLNEKEWTLVLRDFAHCLMNIIMMRPTNLIILGGGIAINQFSRINKLKKILEEKLTVYPVPEIKISKLRENLGLFGSLALINLNIEKKHV